jgi:DNA-binding NarL/FixJ family response regulator
LQSSQSVLLSLFRAARELPTAEFELEAVRLLRSEIGFDSANWGSGYTRTQRGGLSVVPVANRSLNIDPEAIQCWASINRADKVIPMVRKSPRTTFNLHAPQVFSRKADLVMRDYTKRFGRQNYLCTALTSGTDVLFEWFSIYRSDPARLFSESERLRCETFLQHLREASEINRLLHDNRAGSRGALPVDGRFDALVDSSGRILSVQEGFLEQCSREWPQFDGSHLPPTLMERVFGSGLGIYRGRACAFRGRRVSDLFLISTGTRRATEVLSPRRMDVATQFAQGVSYKRIARNLGLSPATVRNHLASCYRALDVTSRSALRDALDRQRSAEQEA